MAGESEINHLSNLKAVEVSFVPRGANRKKFLILKEDEMPTIEERIAKTALKNKEQVEKVLKDAGLSPEDSGALQSALRVLTSLGDQVSPELLGQLGSLCGVQMEAPAAPAQVAMEQPTAGQVNPAPTEDDKKPAAAAPAAPAPEKQEKEDKPAEDGDEIMKADGSLDESKIPANLRATVLKLWQKGKDVDAIKKQLDDERDARVTKEYLAKAETFTHLPGIKKEDLGAVLKELSLKAPTVFDKVEGVLKAANDALANSPAMREVGSSVPPAGGAAGAGTSYEMIEQAAMQQPIAKEQGMKKEAATTYFITKTAEGRKMYSDYRAGLTAKN